jgi:ABC-type transport system involved in multi-copper enzyme maturation permease subunit
MIAKELLENRWKLIAGSLLAIVAALTIAVAYDLVRNLLANANPTQLPDAIASQLGNLSAYNAYLWSMWFNKTGVQLANIFAGLLGAPLIAGEVTRGSIFFLLSRTLSRDRILLLKYVTSAAILAAIAAAGSITLWLGAALQGQFQPVGGLLLSTLLIWSGSLLVLGVALFFSILLNETLRAFTATAAFMALLAIPTLVPALQPWTPASYWTSLPVYLGVELPIKALSINLVAAVLPLALALALFRRRAY